MNLGKKSPIVSCLRLENAIKNGKGAKKISRAVYVFRTTKLLYHYPLPFFYSENERSSAVHHHYLVGCLCPSFFYLQQVQLRGAKICMLWKQHNLDLFFASNAVWQPAFFALKPYEEGNFTFSAASSTTRDCKESRVVNVAQNEPFVALRGTFQMIISSLICW